MQRGQRAGSEHPRHEQLGVALQDDQVAQPPPRRALADDLAIAAAGLDADQVRFRVGGGMPEREASAAGADLQLDRRRPSEIARPVWKQLRRQRAAVRNHGRLQSRHVLASHRKS